MIEVRATQVIPLPLEQVWELLGDTSRYPEWVEGTAEVTRTDGPAREGSTYHEVNPILGPWKAHTSWLVTEFSPPRRQVHLSTDIPLTSSFEVIMEVDPEGTGEAALVTLTLAGTPSLGPVGAAFGRLMKSSVARDNRRSLENLASVAAC